MSITTEQLATWASLKPDDDTKALSQVVDATNAYVASLPIVANSGGGEWSPDVVLGALMLAHRTWRRRSSPNGIEGITEVGVAYVSRYDPEVSRLLALEAPAVG